MNRRSLALIFGAIVLFFCLGSFALTAVIAVNAERAEEARAAAFAPLIAICEQGGGAGAPAAASYDSAALLSPTLVVHQGGSSWNIYNEDYPEAWNPSVVAEAQLVACVQGQDAQIIESCDYYETDVAGNPTSDASFVERRQYERTVLLYSAVTGELVAKERILGSIPAECGDEVFFEADGQVIYENGSTVGVSSVSAWLAPHVE